MHKPKRELHRPTGLHRRVSGDQRGLDLSGGPTAGQEQQTEENPVAGKLHKGNMESKVMDAK